MKISDCCNRNVIVMDSYESVQSAAKMMRQHHVGDVVLVELSPFGAVQNHCMIQICN